MQLLEEAIFEELPDATEKFILKNVKLIGVKSDNNRKYPIEVLQEAKNLYNEVPVYMGHKQGKRVYTERLGVVKNPICKATGLYGDLHLNPFHVNSPAVQWDYENNSKSIGLSHDADGVLEKGVVKKLKKVYSLDLVTEPATTESLREEVDQIEVIKKELSELNTKVADITKENTRLMEQIEELKNRKPITSGSPVFKEEKLDIDTWVKDLRKV